MAALGNGAGKDIIFESIYFIELKSIRTVYAQFKILGGALNDTGIWNSIAYHQKRQELSSSWWSK